MTKDNRSRKDRILDKIEDAVFGKQERENAQLEREIQEELKRQAKRRKKDDQ